MGLASDSDLKLLFTEARTHNGWQDKPVETALLQQLYDLAKMGPTSANSSPMRVLFVRSAEAKEKLRPALSPANVDKTMAAPATAVIAHDLEFHAQMLKLFPVRDLRASMGAMPAGKRDAFLLQNSSLQAGYFILAARALGLDCGPMGGFDAARVDAAFFADGKWRSSLLINLGYGDPAKLRPRGPRLSFEEACRIE